MLVGDLPITAIGCNHHIWVEEMSDLDFDRCPAGNVPNYHGCFRISIDVSMLLCIRAQRMHR